MDLDLTQGGFGTQALYDELTRCHRERRMVLGRLRIYEELLRCVCDGQRDVDRSELTCQSILADVCQTISKLEDLPPVSEAASCV